MLPANFMGGRGLVSLFEHRLLARPLGPSGRYNRAPDISPW